MAPWRAAGWTARRTRLRDDRPPPRLEPLLDADDGEVRLGPLLDRHPPAGEGAEARLVGGVLLLPLRPPAPDVVADLGEATEQLPVAGGDPVTRRVVAGRGAVGTCEGGQSGIGQPRGANATRAASRSATTAKSPTRATSSSLALRSSAGPGSMRACAPTRPSWSKWSFVTASIPANSRGCDSASKAICADRSRASRRGVGDVGQCERTRTLPGRAAPSTTTCRRSPSSLTGTNTLGGDGPGRRAGDGAVRRAGPRLTRACRWRGRARCPSLSDLPRNACSNGASPCSTGCPRRGGGSPPRRGAPPR